MDAKTVKTPDTLPWIPPGKPKDESFNKFVHKKGSIASRINAEVSHRGNHSYSPKHDLAIGMPQVILYVQNMFWKLKP